jgi:hypothetical protein
MNDTAAHSDNIQLADSSSVKVAVMFLAILMLAGSAIEYLIFRELGTGLTLLVSGLAAIAIFAAIALAVLTSVATAYIRGGMLIVKYLHGRPKITDLKVIRTERNYKLLGIRLTQLRFRIDGKHSRAILLGTGRSGDPMQILRSARHAA